VAQNKSFSRPGTRTVRVAVRKDPHGRWLVLCTGLFANIRYPIDEEDTAWLESRYLPPAFMNPDPKPEPFDKPFELIRLREGSMIPRPTPLPAPATEKGLLIWLEP